MQIYGSPKFFTCLNITINGIGFFRSGLGDVVEFVGNSFGEMAEEISDGPAIWDCTSKIGSRCICRCIG
jgi:hypothetical protein